MMISMAHKASAFKAKLHESLLQKGMSQADLARATSAILGHTILPQSINRYVGGASPRPMVAMAIAKALEVDPAWLYSEDDNRPLQAPGSTLSGAELRAACTERYFTYATTFAELLNQAEKVDWETLGDRIANRKQLAAPATVQQATQLIDRLFKCLRHALEVFHPLVDPGEFSTPGREVLRLEALRARVSAILGRFTGNQAAKETLEGWMHGFDSRVAPDDAMAAAQEALNGFLASAPPDMVTLKPVHTKATRRRKSH